MSRANRFSGTRVVRRLRAASLSAIALTLMLGLAQGAAAIDITGSFSYEDRQWDTGGYTGTVQNLPIRYADVEVVRASDQAILGSGSADADGSYSISISLGSTSNLYVRCLSSTDYDADYHIYVVDDFVRTGGTIDLSGSTTHAITTSTQSVNPATPSSGDFGDYLIQDTTGSGVAQAYNILDCGVDSFDYMETSPALGRLPTAGEFVVYGWNGTSGATGSNYYWQGIYIASTASDTDGWSDAVILHETGHWASDLFGRDHNPGGSHYIGDNFQDPRLSYGEGYATYFCALVREFRAPRLNGSGNPVDEHVSLYCDLAIPPTLPTAGGLEFGYDFETGLYVNGTPVGQIGSANETNVTSAMWDLIDGAGTPDESPGADDETADETGALSWDVTANYMPGQGDTDPLTAEDFYAGWFARHGAGFMQAEIESAFVGLALMPFALDAYEPDDNIATATPVVPLAYNTTPGGGVVISECDLGREDRIEIYNAGETTVDLTGWVLLAYRNGMPTATFTFPSFTLYSGSFAVVHELGDAVNNGAVHLYDENFSLLWANALDGACTLENSGGTAIDFVRWDNVSGSDPSTTPTPPGLSWTGSVFSPLAGNNLARDADGTDTDDASDFASRVPSLGAPTYDHVQAHTIYPADDHDVFAFSLQAGDLVTIQAQAPHSAGQPILELLSASGQVQGSSQASHGIASLAEMQILAPQDTTLYARVRNNSPYTDYAAIELGIFKRPSANVLYAPAALGAVPANESDTVDPVELTWFNAGAYDAIEVRRDGGLIATLPGDATNYGESRPAGLYTYDVRGTLGGDTSDPSSYRVYAGKLDCFTAEDLESGSGNLVTEGSWGITGAISADGSYSLADSPSGDYDNSLDVSAEVIRPAKLLDLATLEFDHICITEDDYDYGYVEISNDFGNHWTTLARYDMGDHPEWADGSAGSGDWVHESIDISDYLTEKVRVRFRLVTDVYVTEDGWYIDNIQISTEACSLAAPVAEILPAGVRGLQLSVTPRVFRGSVSLSLDVPQAGEAHVQVFDTNGRLIRRLFDGRVQAHTDLVWDGRSDGGYPVATGLYLIRAAHGEASRVRRVIRLR